MSLSLIQGYSSAEDEPDQDQTNNSDLEHSDDDAPAPAAAVGHPSLGDRSIFDHLPNPPSASGLPSAFDAFSEVTNFPWLLSPFQFSNFPLRC